ncbi:thioredoxin family protein [Thalassotalea sp. LPB0316]|uniref:thioredoxin family protein n=1 Tax=Thalassotalea sp. LPB0316 TaxID=2769490 RepID=UPI001867D01C|nr:thioredoxin family protein [Thalassotalea sp. LPB0316]QOL26942.1 thioredoxin family protein [Thalassotalea sp. LPB0316]
MQKVSWLIIAALIITGFSFVTHAGSKPEHDFPVGDMTQEQVLEHQGFKQSFDNFSLTEDERDKVQMWGKDIRIDVFFAIWCHDSEREVPRLLKALETKPGAQIKLYALDVKKSDPKGLAKLNKVKYTPTMIVYVDDKEVGRVIERPEVSLVEDIHQLLVK